MKHKGKVFYKFVVLVGTVFLFQSIFMATEMLADICFITNKSVAPNSLTRKEIKEIFTGKRVKWSDKSKINVVIQHGTELHKKFTSKYTSRTVSQFEKWWRTLLFTGKGSMPKAFKSEKKLLDYVAKTDGAIGYISSENKNNQVNIITISE